VEHFLLHKTERFTIGRLEIKLYLPMLSNPSVAILPDVQEPGTLAVTGAQMTIRLRRLVMRYAAWQ